ncbi:MAG: ArsA family ATPase [Actinomycetota bacterium]
MTRTPPRPAGPRPAGPRPAADRPAAGRLGIDALLDDPQTRVVVCCGSGGVGKTTTAAALGLRAAERGRQAVVLTIDPARRLAQALGLRELDNTPRRVAGAGRDGGELHAMMLDMKRTFDEVVLAHAGPEKAAQILANPFYQALSASFAGTQEYMAMEKLGQLRAEDRWDLVVVDTPPSRSALDFLDAPRRLGSFLDSRFLRLLTAPARAGGRAYRRVFALGVGLGVGAVTAALSRVLGGQVLQDVQTFVAALDTMFGGFRERAEATYAMLGDRGTAFLVVASPDPDPLREASYFLERLGAEHMPLAGVVLNRVQPPVDPEPTAERCLAAAQVLERSADPDPGHHLTAALLRLRAERLRRGEREARLRDRFLAAHPGVALADVPAQPADVHDLAGLRVVGAALARS